MVRGLVAAPPRLAGRSAPGRRWHPTRAERRLRRHLADAAPPLPRTGAASAIVVCGVHGGAGASTLTLLLSELGQRGGDKPALAVDLAGPARGGLALLAAAGGESTAEGVAAAAVARGSCLGRPLGATASGVRVMGAPPDVALALGHAHAALAARLAAAIDEGLDDEALGRLARGAAREARAWEALADEEARGALGTLLDRACGEHALVAVDLGLGDNPPVATGVHARAALQVWVLPGRSSSLEFARRRLAGAPAVAAAEAIAVWQSGPPPSARVLGELGALRGCPVVRLGNHGDARRGWPAMVERCLPGLEELCALAA
jgi:hypothetical protein